MALNSCETRERPSGGYRRHVIGPIVHGLARLRPRQFAAEPRASPLGGRLGCRVDRQNLNDAGGARVSQRAALNRFPAARIETEAHAAVTFYLPSEPIERRW